MELLRKYCLGSKEIKLQFLSDPEVAFSHCAHKTVNYEDPNLNVCMPIFSIHGNHDDPSFGAVGSMDLLSVSGLVNYFGKWTDLTKISISPLVLKKGETHIALYGLSYINDQRLSRLLRDYKMDLLRPKDIPDCYNIFVLHQNRAVHKEYGHIPENKLPGFLDFIVWGHEHECRISPEALSDASYLICQPGSSIATSLSEGEAKPKHVGILSISKQKFKMKPLKLKTVRPFVFDNLILREQNIRKDYTQPLSKSVYNFIDNYIENTLIPKAATQLSGHPKQPIQPLIRLRVFYTSEDEMFDGMQLAQKYCDEVANPMDMILFRKESTSTKRSKSSTTSFNDDPDEMAQIFQYEDDVDWNKTVQGGIKKHFSLEENKDKITVLSVNGLNEALNRFIERGDTDAFKDIISHHMKKTIAYLETCNVTNTESILNEIKNLRDKRMEKEQEEEIEIQQFFNDPNKKKSCKDTVDVIDSDDDEQTTMTKGRGARGRGAPSRGRGSRGGGRGKNKNTPDVTITSISSGKPKDQTSLRAYVRASNKKNIENIVIDDSD
ncbi:double strand break repair nuclease mre11 isoform X2 [Megachile rotundata]